MSAFTIYFPRYSTIKFIGAKKKKGRTAGKVVYLALTNWVSSPCAPGIILTGKYSRFIGSEFRNIATNKILHYNRLFLGFIKG